MFKKVYQVQGTWTVRGSVQIIASNEEEAFEYAQDVEPASFQDYFQIEPETFELDPFSVKRVKDAHLEDF